MEETLVDTSGRPRNTRATARILRSNDGRCRRRIGVIADTQGAYDGTAKVVKALNASGPFDFHVLVGDVTDLGLAWEFDRMNDQLDRLAAPLVTVMGNHDGIGKGKKIFKALYGSSDFILDLAPYRFVFWDNNVFEHGGQSRLPQLRELLGEPGPPGLQHGILFSHIPRVQASTRLYSSADTKAFCELVRSHSIELSIHGHRHSWGHVGDVCGEEVLIERVGAGEYSILELECDRWRILRCHAERGCARWLWKTY